jgi:chromosome segregation ATPase
MSEKVQRLQATLNGDGFEFSPSKKDSKSFAKTRMSAGGKSPSLALTIIPSVAPNSDFANRLNNGMLSASKEGLPSNTNKRDNHNNIYHEKAKTLVFKSPNNKHNKTISLLSPSKSQTSVMATTINNHKQQPSEIVLKRFEDVRQTRDEKKQLGTEVFENVNYRKEVEKQVSMLETRVKRLQQEEKEIIKKINDTSDKTEKIIGMKKQHQEHLVDKANRKKNIEDTTEKRRQEIIQYREDQKNQIQSSVLDSLNKRQLTATSVKNENGNLKDEKNTKQDETLNKNKDIIKKINETHAEFLARKQALEEQKKEKAKSGYNSKLETERKKTEDLQSKFKELEEMEQQLLKKLSNTYNVHQEKINKLEKAFNLKVSADQPVEFDPNAEEEAAENEEEEEAAEEEGEGEGEEGEGEEDE